VINISYFILFFIFLLAIRKYSYTFIPWG